MINATEFYQASLAKQREVIKDAIKTAMDTGDPIIELPFDTYPIIEEEMEDLGYEYDYYESEETGKRYAIFYPEQYNYDN